MLNYITRVCASIAYRSEMSHLADDLAGESLVQFVAIQQKRPDLDAKAAAQFAIRRARRLVLKGYRAETRNYSRFGMVGDAVDSLPANERPYRDPSDHTEAEKLIDLLPAELQPVARMLSYGRSIDDICELRKISRTTLWRMRREIRGILEQFIPAEMLRF